MGLQFILGPASRDHAQAVTESLKQGLRDYPNDQFFYLVPNHIKFESEVKTLERLSGAAPVYAQTNVQIFSISRLAWYFLSHEAAYQVPRISAAGINMLIYQIILEHADELTVFRGNSGQPGFIDQIAKQISEMQAGQIGAADLAQLVTNRPDGISANLFDKLHDFTVIYGYFETATNGQFIHQNDTLRLLCEYLDNHDLSHMHFLISGFSQLTAQERALMLILMQRGASLTVDLNLDKPAVNGVPEGPNLFYQPAKLYHQLYRFAKDHQVPVMVDRYAKEQRTSDDLVSLERYLIESSGLNQIQAVPLDHARSVQVVQADNYYSELSAVAIQIRRLVASGQYHYRDILVLTRHLSKYQNIIAPIFKMQSIPFFNDVHKSMVDHPLVQLIDALFSIDQPGQRQNYRYADMMRLLKTELLIPRDEDGNFIPIDEFRDALALTENAVLKNGYEGARWLQDEDWHYVWLNESDFGIQSRPNQSVDAKLNLIRHYVKDTLPRFFKRLKRAKTVTDAVKVLYQFLVDTGVADQLKRWRDGAVDAGELSTAAEPEQVWQTFCDLLDSFVSILGDHHAFKQRDFLALLKAGFEGANYSQIPSTLDQLTISESGIVQMPDYKVVFMVGSTDDVMPDKVEDDHLFNDVDRDDLTSYFSDGQYLSDGGEDQLANDPYLNYLAFMSASQRIIFSYSLANDSDSETGVQISPYVSRIEKHFNIVEHRFQTVPTADDDRVLRYVGTPRMTLHYLVQASADRQYHDRALAPAWQLVYQLLTDATSPLRHLTPKLLGGLHYKNQPTPLDSDIVVGLYGETINASISQLEQFYANPYEYFLKYGLKLHERDVFELSPASTGEFYHAALDQLVKRMRAEHFDLADLDAQQLDQLVDEVATQILNDDQNYQYEILKSSYRMGYLKQQLIKTVKRMALTMHLQSQKTPMRPEFTEIPFGRAGQGESLAPLRFDLSSQLVVPAVRKIEVRGRIDRVDAMDGDAKRFLELVDYKSGARDLNFGEVYAGTSLQLLTYLDVIKRNLAHFSANQKAELAGALYMHVFNPKLAPGDLQTVDFESAMLKKQRYRGIIVDDADLIKLIDSQMQAGGNSLVYPIGLKKKDLTPTKLSSIIKPDELDLLLEYTEKLIQDAGVQIFNGDVSLAPTRTQQQTALQYSPYQSIMQFDPLLRENNYRNVDGKMKLEDIIAKLRGTD